MASENGEVKTETPRKRIFYGWWIVAAASLAQALNGGLYFYGFGAFFMPLVQEFGWSRAALSGAISIARLESGVTGPLEGYLVDRFGPRPLMLGGLAVMGMGFILLALVDSLLTLYLVFFFFLAMGASFGTGLTTMTAVANWFARRRSLAMGILNAGFGAGAILVFGLAWLIAQYGWRWAAVAAGITIWVFGLPLALLMRQRPEQYGLLPDGDPPPPKEEQASSAAPARRSGPAEVNFTVGESLRTRAFWLLSTVAAIRGAVTGGVAVHFIPLLQDKGFSPEVAGLLMAALGVVSVAGRLGFGYLGDVMSKKHLIALTLSLMVVSVAPMPLVETQSLWLVALLLVLYAPAYGGAGPLTHAIRADYFGRRSFGTIRGAEGMIQMVGTIVGPLLAGYLFDVTKSYQGAFAIFSVASLAAVALILIARPPSAPSPSPAPTAVP